MVGSTKRVRSDNVSYHFVLTKAAYMNIWYIKMPLVGDSCSQGLEDFFMLQAGGDLGQKTWELLPFKETNELNERSRDREYEELLASPKSVEMWWEPRKKNDDSCDQWLDVFFFFFFKKKNMTWCCAR